MCGGEEGASEGARERANERAIERGSGREPQAGREEEIARTRESKERVLLLNYVRSTQRKVHWSTRLQVERVRRQSDSINLDGQKVHLSSIFKYLLK